MTGQKIGFIGLGAMGIGMSKNLLNAGFSVCGYDINAESMTALIDAGGNAAANPGLVAADVSLLIVCVFGADQAEEVLYGKNGAAERLPKGSTVVIRHALTQLKAPDIGIVRQRSPLGCQGWNNGACHITLQQRVVDLVR